MIVYNLEGTIESDMFDIFLEWYNTIEDKGERVVIMLDSSGGLNTYGERILYLIDTLQDVHLVAAGMLGSYAFELFVRAKTPNKVVLETCMGMYHLTKIQPQTLVNGEYSQYGEADADWSDFRFNRQIELIDSLPIPRKKKKKMLKGKDVFFSYEELVKIANNKK